MSNIRMTDILERLRAEGEDAMRKHLSMGMWKLCAEAAAEIERLRAQTNNAIGKQYDAEAEIERLRAALQQIEHATSETMLATNHGRRGDIAYDIAGAALRTPASHPA
jgi:hypothetical protein